MPWRWIEVMPRLMCPSWRWMTPAGHPWRAISTACVCGGAVAARIVAGRRRAPRCGVVVRAQGRVTRRGSASVRPGCRTAARRAARRTLSATGGVDPTGAASRSRPSLRGVTARLFSVTRSATVP
jgi:hypothetical protein